MDKTTPKKKYVTYHYCGPVFRYDATEDRYYVASYDNNGKPRIFDITTTAVTKDRARSNIRHRLGMGHEIILMKRYMEES